MFTTLQCQREKIFAEFEVLIGQLLHHVPHSSEQFSALEARLSDLAHAYCGNPIDIGDFILKECIQATRSLRCNEKTHVTKFDKCSGVVIMNKNDYISKMDFILQDNSKFENLGPSSEFDNTAKIEAHIQRRLLQLKKEGLLPSKIYSMIRPTGSQRPRMYGFPKIHKQDVPLRPILSMTGSAQHQLAQWLTSVIDPVLSLYSIYCISNSFTFADKVKTFNFLHLSFFAPMMSVAFLLMFHSQKLLKSALMLCMMASLLRLLFLVQFLLS